MVNNTNLVLLILYIFIAKILYIFILKEDNGRNSTERNQAGCLQEDGVKMGEGRGSGTDVN